MDQFITKNAWWLGPSVLLLMGIAAILWRRYSNNQSERSALNMVEHDKYFRPDADILCIEDAINSLPIHTENVQALELVNQARDKLCLAVGILQDEVRVLKRNDAQASTI